MYILHRKTGNSHEGVKKHRTLGGLAVILPLQHDSSIKFIKFVKFVQVISVPHSEAKKIWLLDYFPKAIFWDVDLDQLDCREDADFIIP